MTAEPSKRRPRLHRLENIYHPWPVYFVTACTEKRRQIVANEKVHGAFLSFGERGEDVGAWIGRYVLMPDHIHFFVALDEERRLLEIWMKSFKNAISKVLRSDGVQSPHWQKGFFDHVLRSSESYSAKWEYVRSNPVRSGLVRDANDWPYAGEIFALDVR